MKIKQAKVVLQGLALVALVGMSACEKEGGPLDFARKAGTRGGEPMDGEDWSAGGMDVPEGGMDDLPMDDGDFPAAPGRGGGSAGFPGSGSEDFDSTASERIAEQSSGSRCRLDQPVRMPQDPLRSTVTFAQVVMQKPLPEALELRLFNIRYAGFTGQVTPTGYLGFSLRRPSTGQTLGFAEEVRTGTLNIGSRTASLQDGELTLTYARDKGESVIVVREGTLLRGVLIHADGEFHCVKSLRVK